MRLRFLAVILLISPILLISTVNVPSAYAAPSVLIQKIWGGGQLDEAHAVTTDASGNIYVAGFTASYGPGSPSCRSLVLLKYSSLGSLLLQKLWYNGSYVENIAGIVVDSSGNILISGNVLTTCGGGFENGFLIKLDSLGNLVWQKGLFQNPDSIFYGVVVDSTGDAYVTGYFQNGPIGFQDVLLIKFDSATGNVVWQKAWGGGSTDAGYGLAIDSAGNVYVTGLTISFGPSGQNAFLLKFDSSGNLVLKKILGNGGQNGQGVAVDSLGNIYLAGSTSTVGGKLLLMKLDSGGGITWQKTWGGSNGTDNAYSLALDSAGNLEVAGGTSSYGDGGSCGFMCVYPDVLLLRVSTTGNLVSSLVLGSHAVDFEVAYGAADLYGNMIAVGSISGAGPYHVGSGNNTMGAISLASTSSISDTLASTSYPLPSIPSGATYAVSGSQSYSAGRDMIMLRYGETPNVSFATTPGSVGSIKFNGTTYTNGQSVNVTFGNATATATAPSGYTFNGWTTTGGVSVSSPSSTTVQVRVAGSGTLKANFTGSAPLTPLSLLLGVLIAAPVLLVRRRKS